MASPLTTMQKRFTFSIVALLCVAAVFFAVFDSRPAPDGASATSKSSRTVTAAEKVKSLRSRAKGSGSKLAAVKALSGSLSSPTKLAVPTKPVAPVYGTGWGREEKPELKAFSAWTTAYSEASAGRKSQILDEGIGLAKERQLAMSNLIVSNPAAALAAAIPQDVRAELPEEVLAHTERRIFGIGSLQVYGITREKGAAPTGPLIQRQARLGGQSYQASVYGVLSHFGSVDDLYMHGVAVGNSIALADTPMRALEAGETVPAGATIIASHPVQLDQSPPSAAVKPRLAEGAGGYHCLCCSTVAKAEYDVSRWAALGGDGTVAAAIGRAFKNTGNRTVLLIPVEFPDHLGSPWSNDGVRDTGISQIQSYFSAASYGVLNGTATSAPLQRMDNNGAFYANTGSSYAGSDALALHAKAKSLAAGHNPDDYDFVSIVINHNLYSWAGLGQLGDKITWIDGDAAETSAVYIHELGHNLGLLHAGSWDPTNLVPDNPDGLTTEYGNPFDAMGNNLWGSYSYDQLHYNASFKNALDWLPDSYVTTITNGTTLNLYAMDRTQVSGRTYAVKIPAGITLDGISNLDYWVELRSRYTGVDTIQNGVLIYTANTAHDSGASKLLDMAPATSTFLDAGLPIGSSFTTKTGWRVTVNSQSGSGNDSLINVTISDARLSQTITFSGLGNKLVDDAPFAVSATSSSGLAVSLSIVSGPATLSGNTITLTGTGTVTVRASQAGDATYSAASAVLIFTVSAPSTVVAWGDNGSAQATVPDGLSGVTAIVAGRYHTVALKSDGTVVAWGYNNAGQTTVPAGLSGVTAIAAGGYHTVALKSSPVITTQPAALVVNVNASATFTVVAAGSSLTYQWRKDGVAISGATSATLSLLNVQFNQAGSYSVLITNSYGSVTSNVAALTVNQLSQTITFSGLGNKLVDDAPFAVSATSSSGLAVSFSIVSGPATLSGNTITLTGVGSVTVRASQAGDATYSAAVPVDRSFTVSALGTVVAWGSNDYGQTTVPDGLSGVTAIAGRDHHTVALKSDGTVVAWGSNQFGETNVPVGLSGVTTIAAGYAHTAALRSNGTVVAWGFNAYGGTTVPTGLSGVTAIAAGGQHTVALKSDGTVVAWGNVWNGSTYVDATVPTGLSGVTAIAAGGQHTVALKNDGTVVAWGNNAYGQTTVPTGLSRVMAIAASSAHTVALVGAPPSLIAQPGNLTINVTSNATFSVTAAGTPPLNYQWSKDAVPITGATNPSLMLSSVQTNQAGNYVVAISNAYGSVTSNVAVLMVNRLGQTISLGALPRKPADAAPFAMNATASSGLPVSYTSSNPGVATVSGNTVMMTGVGTTTITANQAGDATYLEAVSVSQPLVVGLAVWGGQTNIPTGLSGVVAIAAGYYFTVALQKSGTVVTWEDSSQALTTIFTGSSGITAIAAGVYHTVALQSDGTVVAANGIIPIGVPNGLSGVMAIAAGGYHTMALKTDGTVVAWGPWGYYGTGEATVPVGLSGVIAIAAGYHHSIALKSDGTVVAWGPNNSNGQVSVPPGLSGVIAIAANGYHSAALKSDGTVVAWGGNAYGQTISPPPGLSGVVAIAAGEGHTVALKGDGTVVAWGGNGRVLTDTPPGLSGVTAIAAGGFHTVALVGGVSKVQPTFVVQPPSQNLAAGSSVTFGVLAAGSTPLSYQWWKSGAALPGATTASLTLNNIQSGDAGNYFVEVTNSVGRATSASAVLTVNPATPSIMTQPASLSVIQGASITFTVAATGTSPLSYQWRKSGLPITGATGASFTVNNTQPADASTYDVEITNVVGSVSSSVATLTVTVAPTISTHPQSQPVVLGNSATFTVTATGSPEPTYLWRKDGTDIAGATGSSYTIPNVQAFNAGSFTVVVSNVAGSVTSAPPAVLVVNLPPFITTQPQSKTVTAGANVSFTVVKTGTAPFSYQWRKSGSPIIGATSATFMFNGVQVSDAGAYDVVVLNSGGVAISSVATLTVIPYTNRVLSLGGIVEYATIPSTPAIQPSNAITVELWFLPLAASGVVLNKGDGQYADSARSYEIDYGPQGASFQIFFGTSTYAGISVPAPLNQWVHFAATYDSATSRINIFTNGILSASTTTLNGSKMRQTTLPLTFGFIPGLGNTYFNGSMDEVRIWNYARSGAEILRDFHSRLTGTEPGLVGYWQFDGGTVADMTTNANNGTLAGGAQIVPINGADIPHIGAPTISQMSQILAVAPGTNITLTVAATSSAPVSYQWMKDGVLMDNQTNAQLNLSGLTNRARGGSFTVVVSNLYGATTGNVGSLRVRVPHRLQSPVAANGQFRLLSADQDGGLLTANDLPYFSVQSSTNLAATNWLSFTYTNGLSLTNGMLRLDDTNAASRPFRYYRVIEQ